MAKPSLRLLLWEECNRACEGCCNKQWDLGALEVESDFTKYDEILLTGGEPMLYPDRVIDTVAAIRKQTTCPIYLYTAWTQDIDALLRVNSIVNGLTVTLHTEADVPRFNAFHRELLQQRNLTMNSYRLNVFEEAKMPRRLLWPWQVKRDMEWIEDCPLPSNETFKRVGTT